MYSLLPLRLHSHLLQGSDRQNRTCPNCRRVLYAATPRPIQASSGGASFDGGPEVDNETGSVASTSTETEESPNIAQTLLEFDGLVRLSLGLERLHAEAVRREVTAAELW